MVICTDNLSWHSFLAGFSHWVYCVGFSEANREYWVYVLSFLYVLAALFFMGYTGCSKGGSVVISHSLLSHGGRHGPAPIYILLSLEASALLRQYMQSLHSTDPENHSHCRRYSGTRAFPSHFDSLWCPCSLAEKPNLLTAVLQRKYLDSTTSTIRIRNTKIMRYKAGVRKTSKFLLPLALSEDMSDLTMQSCCPYGKNSNSHDR